VKSEVGLETKLLFWKQCMGWMAIVHDEYMANKKQ